MDQAPLSSDPFSFRRKRRLLAAGGFRTVRLNLVGWTAVVGAGLAAGASIALLTTVPPVVALPAGVLAIWVVLVALDARRHRNQTTHLCHGDLDDDLGAAIVAELERKGIAASYREEVIDDEEDDWVRRGIVCRNADAAIVGETIDRALAGRR